MTLIMLVNTSYLHIWLSNNISRTNTVNLQAVHETNKDIQKIKTELVDQKAPPTYVNFENQILQKLHEYINRSEVIQKALCWKYQDKTGNVIYNGIVIPENCMMEKN